MTLWSTVDSLRDVVYVEFYDVLAEEDFDPKKRQLHNLTEATAQLE